MPKGTILVVHIGNQVVVHPRMPQNYFTRGSSLLKFGLCKKFMFFIAGL